MEFPWITSILNKKLLLGTLAVQRINWQIQDSRIFLSPLFSEKKKVVSGRYLLKREALWQELQIKPMAQFALKLPKQDFS